MTPEGIEPPIFGSGIRREGGDREKKKGKKNPLFLFSFLHLLGPFLPKLQLEFWLETLESEQTQVPDRGLVTTFFFPSLSLLSTKEKILQCGDRTHDSLKAAPRLFSSRKKWIQHHTVPGWSPPQY